VNDVHSLILPFETLFYGCTKITVQFHLKWRFNKNATFYGTATKIEG